MKIFLLFLIFILSGMAYAAGQAGTDIAVLKAGVGARPLGMGSAFTAVANNADAPYWNPAGLVAVTNNEITTMQTKLSSDADHYYVSYARPALGGTIGMSWIQVGLGAVSQTSAEVDPHNEVQNLNLFSYFSNAYLLSYGKNLSDYVSAGVTAKYLTSDMYRVSGGQAQGYSVTPGILVRRGGFSVGAQAEELFNQQVWGTGTVERVPPKIRLGLAYRAKNPGLFAVDICQTIRSGYTPVISAGYEYENNGLSLRMGQSENGPTAGAGFKIQHARVDYAYVTQPALSRENVHRISLSGMW
jgi:hypothetical protein